jgi:hypothetical protein
MSYNLYKAIGNRIPHSYPVERAYLLRQNTALRSHPLTRIPTSSTAKVIKLNQQRMCGLRQGYYHSA